MGGCSISLGSGATLKTLIEGLACLISLAIPVIASIALLAFMWGVFQFYIQLDNADKRKEARNTILWSILALFIIFTLGGIVAVFTSTFGIEP